jgi:hypothetical protein
MSEIGVLSVRLERLLGSIRLECHRRTVPKVRSTHDASTDLVSLDRVDGWRRELQQIIRQLQSMRHSLQLEAGSLHAVPREMRYSARQSVRDRTSRVEALRADALHALKDILPAIESELGRRLSVEEIFNAIDEIKDFGEAQVSLHDRSTIAQSISDSRGDGPVLRSLARDSSGAPDLSVTVTTLYVLIRMWALKLRPGKRN